MVTIACISVAYFGNKFVDARNRRNSVATLSSYGGKASYFLRSSDNRLRVYLLTMLEDVCNADFVDFVTKVDLSGTEIDDSQLTQLSNLKNLTVIVLNDTNITDLGIAKISSLKNLNRCELQHTQIGDKSIVYLAKLPRLKCVDLRRTNVTQMGKRHLNAMRPDIHLLGE